MIQIIKSDRPAWLVKNQKVKTEEYINAPRGQKPTPWKAEEIISTLKQECSKKCMYCESVIDDVSYSAVEHILPKSVFEKLVLEWSNLGLVCVRCNTNKSDYWTEDASLRLLNPYEDDLDDHIDFKGPLTVARLSSSRGQNTIRKLKLSQREDLVFSRMQRIESLNTDLRNWQNEQNPEIKALYAEDVMAAIAQDREFSGVLRAYAEGMGFEIE